MGNITEIISVVISVIGILISTTSIGIATFIVEKDKRRKKIEKIIEKKLESKSMVERDDIATMIRALERNTKEIDKKEEELERLVNNKMKLEKEIIDIEKNNSFFKNSKKLRRKA